MDVFFLEMFGLKVELELVLIIKIISIRLYLMLNGVHCAAINFELVTNMEVDPFEFHDDS